jgi:hypothetical protein
VNDRSAFMGARNCLFGDLVSVYGNGWLPLARPRAVQRNFQPG